VWLPDQPQPVILPRTSEALYLLQRARDEAHRFAITYHRQKRSKAMTRSALDDVPGLGEGRRKAILRMFGSVKKLRAATVEEIATVPGVGRRTAEAVHAALSGVATETSIDTVTGEIVGGGDIGGVGDIGGAGDIGGGGEIGGAGDGVGGKIDAAGEIVALSRDTDVVSVGGSEPSP
jgi:excinuclease ABC subunit C